MDAILWAIFQKQVFFLGWFVTLDDNILLT
jgi:hypothetical protein